MSRRCRWSARPDEACSNGAGRRNRPNFRYPLLKGATRPGLRLRAARLLVVAALAMTGPAVALAFAAAGGAEMQGAHVVSWGRVEVAASPELAFAVLTDYDRMADFLPGMLASEVVARKGNSVVIEQSANEGIFLFRQRIDVRLAIDETPPLRLTIRALAGSFKELTGSYLLTRMRDHTLIEYRGRFLPDFDLPPVIGTYAVQRSLERHLSAMATEMDRRLADAAPAAAAAPADPPPGPVADPASPPRIDGPRGE
jgi:ribosome-associated toxin RatA of RatAB toxin-antitoxin module